MNHAADFRFRSLSWPARGTYLAHAFKAVTKQHHGEMRPLMRSLVPRDAVVMDVGGHAGQFATLLARLAPDGLVYSFEPAAYARSLLMLAIRSNRIENVIVRAEALGDSPGEAALNVPVKKKGSVRFGLSHLGAPRADLALRETVPVTTIDRFASESGLRRLDFIKADIEGWEMRMLAGGEASIRRFRPTIMVELIDAHLARAGDSLAALWSMLVSWGFRPHRWAGAERLEPVLHATEGDLFWLPR
jgi:FkbM family methyltransferase